jgi:hypothetical protein
VAQEEGGGGWRRGEARASPGGVSRWEEPLSAPLPVPTTDHGMGTQRLEASFDSLEAAADLHPAARSRTPPPFARFQGTGGVTSPRPPSSR